MNKDDIGEEELGDEDDDEFDFIFDDDLDFES